MSEISKLLYIARITVHSSLIVALLPRCKLFEEKNAIILVSKSTEVNIQLVAAFR